MANTDLIRKSMTRTQYKYWRWYAKEGKSYTWIARRYGKPLPSVWLTIKRGEIRAKKHLRILKKIPKNV